MILNSTPAGLNNREEGVHGEYNLIFYRKKRILWNPGVVPVAVLINVEVLYHRGPSGGSKLVKVLSFIFAFKRMSG